MPRMEDLVAAATRASLPAYEEALRGFLEQQDREWLVEQLVRLSLDERARDLRDARVAAALDSERRAQRAERLRAIDVDLARLATFVQAWDEHDRERHGAAGHVHAGAPEPGTAALEVEHRSEQGEALLLEAKDLLFAVLFGDELTDSRLERDAGRELLTIVLPAHKAGALAFLQATTATEADGTWLDPEQVSDDIAADNVQLEVEFGEVEHELAGRAALAALRLINDLEVNEQVLYARLEQVEQSSLDPD